ncbi:FAD-dependent oxidoreductase [Tropicibacter oceani]|uniref:FAD-dependent oxidoreductase n=1 Tax=Tropicibacter oceani TaxID=3058420 RepID=A0ABY8QCT2_9RHOB|nr:FAD-dependent oxidoreductase [Tropicibacter oceani]WGW02434.1 FAD-dependent oxidoreductase [Tropicibacter oceani]
MTKSDKTGMNRRTMLAATGAAGLAATITPVQAALLPDPDVAFDFDVVVVGTGMTGVAAALEAAQTGARVVVLEKLSEKTMGGNSALAGGGFAVPSEDSDAARQSYVEDFIKKGKGRGNSALYDVFAANARRDVDWLRENGVTFLPEGPLPPYRLNIAVAEPGWYMGMPSLLKSMRAKIEEAGGEYRFDTKARQLKMDKTGAVVGLRAVGPDGVVDFNAPSVVLATGGYAANRQMLADYSDPEAGGLMVRGRETATGDGLLMAQEAGAGLAGMGGLMALHIAAVDPRETAAGNPWAVLPYTVAVNRHGKRYVDESLGYVAHGKSMLRQPGQRAALIFGSGIAESDAAQPTLGGFKRLGIAITEADSLDELAAAIDVPADALKATVEEYNAAIDGDAAPGLVPPKAALARRIEGPRFFAIQPLAPGVTLTFGGIMIDPTARALEADGRVIPGLFAAGEGAGAPFFDDYIGGGSLINCLVMGRVAGNQAAARAKS